jgi:hypothetical protein
VFAHESLLVIEGLPEHGHVARRADVPEYDGRVAFQPAQLRTFIGDPLNAAPNSSCDMPNSSRASCRASLPASVARGAKGEPAGNRLAYLMFHGQVVWDVRRHTRSAIPLGTAARALAGAPGK